MSARARFLICLVVGVTAVLVALFWSRLYLREQPVSGDEPHYLVMTQSLVDDRDLELKDDYGQARYQAFYTGGTLNPHGHVVDPEPSNPTWHAIHGPGLPMLLAAPYALLGLDGVTLVMVLGALLVAYLSYRWVNRVTANRWAALGAAGVLFSSASFLSVSGTVYPDLPIALLTVAGLLWLESPSRSRWRLAGLGLLLGLAPWIHTKAALLVGTIVAIALWQLLRAARSKPCPPWRTTLGDVGLLLGPAAVLIALFEWKFAGWFGTLLPSQVYQEQLFALSPLFSLPAMAFDATKGLFTNNPVFLLVFVGLPIWYRHNRGQLGRVALIVLPTLLINATFGDWWGGYSPPGRYLMELLPAALPAIGFALLPVMRGAATAQTIVPRVTAVIAGLLVAAQLWITATMIATNARWTLVTDSNPVFDTIRNYTPFEYATVIPKFGPEHLTVGADRWRLGLMLIVVVALVWLGWRLASDPATRRVRRSNHPSAR